MKYYQDGCRIETQNVPDINAVNLPKDYNLMDLISVCIMVDCAKSQNTRRIN